MKHDASTRASGFSTARAHPVRSTIALLVLTALAACGGGGGGGDVQTSAPPAPVAELTPLSATTSAALKTYRQSAPAESTVAVADLTQSAITDSQFSDALAQYRRVLVVKASLAADASTSSLPADIEGSSVLSYTQLEDGSVSVQRIEGETDADGIASLLLSAAATKQMEISAAQAMDTTAEVESIIALDTHMYPLRGGAVISGRWEYNGNTNIDAQARGETFDFTVDSIDSQRTRCPCNNGAPTCDFTITTSRATSTTQSFSIGGSPALGRAANLLKIAAVASYTQTQTETIQKGMALKVSLKKGWYGTPAMRQVKQWVRGDLVDHYHCVFRAGSGGAGSQCSSGETKVERSPWSGWAPQHKAYNTVNIQQASCS